MLQASKALPSSTYETGVTLKTSLPRWLQDEMESNPLFQGQLEKRNGPGLWHPRYCIIENGTLACYAQKGSQIPTQVQPLANCTVTGSNKDRRKNVFKVMLTVRVATAGSGLSGYYYNFRTYCPLAPAGTHSNDS